MMRFKHHESRMEYQRREEREHGEAMFQGTLEFNLGPPVEQQRHAKEGSSSATVPVDFLGIPYSIDPQYYEDDLITVPVLFFICDSRYISWDYYLYTASLWKLKGFPKFQIQRIQNSVRQIPSPEVSIPERFPTIP